MSGFVLEHIDQALHSHIFPGPFQLSLIFRMGHFSLRVLVGGFPEKMDARLKMSGMTEEGGAD